MGKKLRKILSFVLALTLLISVLSVCAYATGHKGETKDIKPSDVLSPGLFVIAEKSDMAKAGIRGRELSFKRDDFSRALNLSSVSSITFTSVPNNEDGKLTLGGTVLMSGQTVSGSNLSLIRFNAESRDVESTSFKFRPGDAPYEIECAVYMLDKVNFAPSISLASSVSLDVSTYENVKHYGRLSAYDPDSDKCIYEIVSYPRSGRIEMGDEGTGEYVYTPNEGFVGKDSFKYVARDMYGNYSPAATVSIAVGRTSFLGGFDDMKDSSAHAAAIKLSEVGIMSGTQIGDGYYFQPEKTVSRAEFVVLAMQAMGIKDVNTLRVTDFADDSDIPTSMKGYVSAAYELEYVSGLYSDGKPYFLPNQSITRAEAAVIVGRMLGAATSVIAPTLLDSEDIPTYARSYVYSMCSMGVLDTLNGEIRANELLNRADTARMLCAMMKYSK